MFKLSTCLVVIAAIGIIVWRCNLLGAGELARHTELDTDAAKSAVASLKNVTPDSDMETLKGGIAAAVKTLGEEHFAAQMLRAVDAGSAAGETAVQSGVARVIESLTFRPLIESRLPVGFPEFTPLHHIEVKTLPEYRMARTSMSASRKSGGNSSFWKLFSHIKRNEIAMTAPVQMDYTGNKDDAEIASMAFLYRSTEIGQTGRDSADAVVEVVDLPKQQVVSIGMRGRMTDESVERGHQALLDWLKERTNNYRPVGPLRRMGYNSPFVPAERAFFELQIPVQPIDDPIAAD